MNKVQEVQETVRAVADYIFEVSQLAKTGKATEHTFRGALAALLDALAPGLKAVNEPRRTDCGAPDYIVQDRTGLGVFYVEAKDLGDDDLDGRKRTGHKEQFDRYKAALDRIIFTDYLDFRLYRHGQFANSVRIAVWDGEGKVSGRPAAYDDLAALVADAAAGAPQKIDSAKKLAELMAGKARLLQRNAARYLAPLSKAYDDAPAGAKPPATPILELLLGLRDVLMPDVGADEFSDIFAQTLTYGMFAARLNDPTPEDFSRYEAMALIPRTNPFLKQLFQYVANNLEDELEWMVDDLADLFRSADVAKIMRGYGRTGADPMIHFYEDFLAAYDAGLRKDRGVWYTPIQVVKFIVGAADWALRTRFGLPDGLADRSKVEIEREEIAPHGKRMTHKVKKTVHRVQLLDPATGTGTFIAESIRRIFEKFKGNEGVWPGYVESDLLPRLNGFELLMASYTMAHIKIDFALRETGATPSGKERFRVFLTDSLSDWHKELPGGLFASALAPEQQGADEVKRDTPVMVVMGNPPYSISSQNNNPWIQNLVADYKQDLEERNIQPLNDDYIKFIRLGQHYVEKNGSGILAFITNNSYLDGLIHRQMRKSLLGAFDEIYVLNLHGNSRIHETAPDGEKDENVFNIMQGVAITLFVKKCGLSHAEAQSRREAGGPRSVAAVDGTKPVQPCRVYYADLWGRKKDKLAALDDATMETVEWQEVQPTAPMYFFTPKDVVAEAEWNKCFGVIELMRFQSSGVKTHNDNDLVSCLPFATQYNQPYLYRPFDARWVDYDLKKVVRHRYKGMQHMMRPNIALILGRQGQVIGGSSWNLVFLTENISDTNIFYRGGGIVFPLYLYEENMGKMEKRANLDKDVVAKIAAAVSGGQSSMDAIRDFLCGEPVATLTGHEFEGIVGHRAIRDAIYAGYGRVKHVARNAQLGEVRLTRSGITDSMAHGFGRAKLSAFAAVPEMIEHGAIVQHNANWKGRGYESFVLAAPILIGGEPYCAFIVVNSTKEAGRRFYLHEVGRIADIKKTAEGLRSGSSSETPALSRTLGDIKSLAYSLLSVNGASEKTSSLAPIDIFDYIYGVLHSPGYRAKFKEFLKVDFPRIPYPKDAAEFARFRDAGRELRMTHLMRDAEPALSETRARFPVAGDNVVDNVKMLPMANAQLEIGNIGTGNTGNIGNNSYCRVYINQTQYFDNVPLAAWEQAIGGYHPAEKWLKDRKGRALSPDDLRHYQRIVLALAKTRETMNSLAGPT